MSQPLVSIMVPFFNAKATLPMALASLLCQTFENWECILVDDGSTDGSADILARITDRRFRCLRLPNNRGRGVARQIALEAVSGDYLAMLDSDDWWYPTKLELQLNVAESDNGLAVVGSAMALIDAYDTLQAVRGLRANNNTTSHTRVLRKPTNPGLSLPTCLIRTSLASSARYDPALLRSQDLDFVLQVLLDRRYYILPEVLYAYRDSGLHSLKTTLAGLRYTRRIYRKYLRRFPIASRAYLIRDTLKSIVYRLPPALALHRTLTSSAVSPDIQRTYETARARVSQMVQQSFGATRNV